MAEAVEEAGDHLFRIPGASADRVRRALQLLEAAEELRADVAAIKRPQLLRVMSTVHIEALPDATVKQAKRLAALHDSLLATGYHTVAGLRALRGDKSDNATRTWISRRRDAHQLFTVTHEHTLIIPTFQLTDEAEPKAWLEPILRVLAPAELSGWATWTWLTVPSPRVGGHIPAVLAETAPDRVTAAAQRLAADVEA